MIEQALSVREAIVQRRSIKLFNRQPVDRDDLMEILNEAAWAPNHKNREPWRFVVAVGEGLTKWQEVIKDFNMSKWKDLSPQALETQMKKLLGPGAVVFVIVPEDIRQKERLEDYAAASAFIQNAQLLAWDRGIGSCWKTPAYIEDPKIREVLGVQPGERIISMLQFGYFDVVPKGRERTPIEEKTTFFGEE
ncbi:nitroreductase [Chungangia koreensis]|uniref:Putative NAD(P)H nitroreductase n=1 Tax=Chungangia koreensis TaxID=752657 RepID=A0ABV8X6K4_9LACT